MAFPKAVAYPLCGGTVASRHCRSIKIYPQEMPQRLPRCDAVLGVCTHCASFPAARQVGRIGEIIRTRMRSSDRHATRPRHFVEASVSADAR